VNNELDSILAEVRREHGRIEAPAAIENRLRAAVRGDRSGLALRHPIWATAAALFMSVLAWQASRPGPALEPVIRRARPVETMTEFVTVPGTETLSAAVEVSVLRVEVRKGDLRPYGFDVPPGVAAELVRADFVIGDDGVARAVRLVQ
jgi:hypothetical protein